MHIIDRYAYGNHLRQIDPGLKVGLALTVVALCLALNEPAVGLAAVGWMVLLTVFRAKIPGRTFGRLLLAEVTFLSLTTIGIVLSFSLTDPTRISTWIWRVGPLWISSSPEALQQALLLVTRALGAASAMNFLALTTPLVDIIELLRRWRVPAILIDLMTLIYRFIFVLLDSLERMYRAQDSRLGYQTTYWRAMNNAALLGSRLFIDAFHRSRRLQTSLESRSYDYGDFRVLPTSYIVDRHLAWLGLGMVGTMFLIWLVL